MAITYIENDGGRLAVEVEGEGPLVICSPGMGDFRDAYTEVSKQLVAAGYRVARVDLRGHGDSSATFNNYGDLATADDYLTIIKQLGGGPAVLVGASMSAAAAAIAAGKEPELVAGIVTLGGFLRSPGSKFMVNILLVALWRPWGPAIWSAYSKSLWPGLDEQANKERVARSKKLLTGPKRWSAFHATVAGADHTLVAPYLPNITEIPALVVVGDKDPDWSDPVAEAKWVASNFSSSEVLSVPGAGHAPQFENPALVGPAMVQYLEKINFKQTAAKAAAFKA